MVLSEFDGKYEELRNVYNSVIDDGDEGSRRVPPMGEWRGMTSICDHVFCRWVVIRACVLLGSRWGALLGERSVGLSRCSEASRSSNRCLEK